MHCFVNYPDNVKHIKSLKNEFPNFIKMKIDAQADQKYIKILGVTEKKTISKRKTFLQLCTIKLIMAIDIRSKNLIYKNKTKYY